MLNSNCVYASCIVPDRPPCSNFKTGEDEVAAKVYLHPTDSTHDIPGPEVTEDNRYVTCSGGVEVCVLVDGVAKQPIRFRSRDGRLNQEPAQVILHQRQLQADVGVDDEGTSHPIRREDGLHKRLHFADGYRVDT